LTVAIALPFGLLLGKFNFTLWVCFIVWAEYFALGASPDSWKIVFPAFPAGAAAGALWMITSNLVNGALGSHPLVGLIIGNLIWVTALLYVIPRVKSFTQGTLAVFNGLAMFLGVYFTGSLPSLATDPILVVIVAFVWATLMAYFGWFLGWLNIMLTFPKVEG
jgi:hypothetical protein